MWYILFSANGFKVGIMYCVTEHIQIFLSPSFAADMSAHTAATEFTVSGESNLDVQEAVNRLEFYDRYMSKNESCSTHAQGDAHFEESTLHKYAPFLY